MKEFENLLYDLVKNRPRNRSGKPRDPGDDLLIHMLEDALKEGKINDEQYRANLKITFLTAHENAQQLLNSVFWELGQNQVRRALFPHTARGVTDNTVITARTCKTSCALR